MKKLFTFGIFLLFLVGIGNQASATIIKSAGTGIAGLDWNNSLAWAGGVVPTSANIDSVQIVAGDSITVNVAVQSCQTLIVNGTLNTNGFALYVNGNAYVKSGGILSIVKQVYCKNIYNYGKTWAPGKTNSNSTTTVALYVGYNCSGTTAVASTDSCTILNDGIIGWYRTASISTTTKGCGLFIYYPNIVKAVNITHTPEVTNYAFTALTILPVVISGSTPSQDFNLYFNESVAFVAAGSGQPFSLHANDAFPTTLKRTCTIASGDTVFVAGYFHKNSAPSVTQGPMIYNIYGCLDLGSYRQTKNEFDIFTLAGNGAVTVNIGDGTQSNNGTLVLGGAVNLNAVSAGMIVINPRTYSTLKFGYKAAPTIALTNTSLSAYNLYINSFGIPAASGALSVAGNLTLAGAINNTITLNGLSAQTITGGSQTITGLTVNNASGVSLTSPLTVSGALNLTSGNIALGNNNLTVGSISGGSATSYVITDGTGSFNIPATSAVSTLIPVGASVTSYDPVSVTPTTTSNFGVRAYTTLSGTAPYGVRYNTKEWDITPTVASSTLIALTPSNIAESVTSPIIGHYVSGSYVNNTAIMTNANATYTGTFDTFSPFVTGANIDVTSVDNATNNTSIYSINNAIVAKNLKIGDIVTVYGMNGTKVVSSVATSNIANLAVTKGLYIVKTSSTVQKVSVQ